MPFFLIFSALRKLANEHQDDWDLYLDPVLFSIRASEQCTAKFSPFKLMYNREARHQIALQGSLEDWEGVRDNICFFLTSNIIFAQLQSNNG